MTNEDDVPDAMRKLKTVYPNILRLDYDNARTRSGVVVEVLPVAETKTPMELVSEFYALQNGQPMNEAQSEYMRRLAETVWEEQA
ncbi:MAG: exonuclease SbcCD subunit D C-terminal domain-containing protein [Schwartzia sp.]|nr:exonuclease SbcCD subunit D C-terminal domain-containing protein [Schwartzia sp. (in: firmicutes)]